MNARLVTHSVTNHIIEEVQRFMGMIDDTGIRTVGKIAVFCKTLYRCVPFVDAIVERLNLSSTETYVQRREYITCKHVSSGSEVLIRFVAAGAWSTRGFDTDHMVVIGISLSDRIMVDMVLPLAMQTETTAVVVTDEEIEKGETKLQPLMNWAFEEVTRERSSAISQTILPLVRLFIVDDANIKLLRQ